MLLLIGFGGRPFWRLVRVRLRGLIAFSFGAGSLSNAEGSRAVDETGWRFLDPQGRPLICTIRGLRIGRGAVWINSSGGRVKNQRGWKSCW